ncbi:MAG: transcriptional activator domain containing [Planctomycetota bacterium]|nr:MAG: transcriptional activator domain containing [Planctomycetota bacterium]
MSGAGAEKIAHLQRAVEAARARGPAAEGLALSTLSLAIAGEGEMARARETLAQAEARVHAAGEATDETGKRDWLRLRAAIANVRGRMEASEDAIGRAADSLAEAAHLASEAGDRELRAEALLILATVNSSLGKILDGALQAEEAEDLFVESGARTSDVAARATADRLAAMIAGSDELCAAADEDLEAERKDGKNPRRLGWRLRSAAVSFMTMDDEDGLESAYALLEEAGAAFRLAESFSGEARAIRSQGACLGALGEATEAADAYLEASAIYAELGAKLPQARAMMEAGHASRDAEDALRAAECYEGAAAIFREQESAFEEGFVTEASADLRRDQGKSAESRPLYEKALALYDGSGLELDDQRAGCLLSLGIACREAGDKEKAQQRLGEARAIYDRVGETEMVKECDRELRKAGAVGRR